MRIRNINTGTTLHFLQRGQGAVTSIAFSPDGSFLVSAGRFGILQWRVANGAFERTLSKHTSRVTSVAFSPDGQHLASADEDNKLWIWDTSDGTPARLIEPPMYYIFSSVTFSPDGQYLAAGQSGTTEIGLWRVSDGSLVRTFRDGGCPVTFTPDGQYVVSAGLWTNAIGFWRVQDGILARSFVGHTDRVSSLAISPDGLYLASASEFPENAVRLWRLSDGTPIHILTGHTYSVNCVVFSPDGNYLATGSNDKTVKLWRTSDGSLVYTLSGFAREVVAVAFSPDGQHLATGENDFFGSTRLKIWHVASSTLVATYEQEAETGVLSFNSHQTDAIWHMGAATQQWSWHATRSDLMSTATAAWMTPICSQSCSPSGKRARAPKM